MLERLKKRWKASGLKLVLILATFALGGSLTGFVGKKLMNQLAIENDFAYAVVYLVIITILWPLMVMVVSLPMGQFSFFKKYISRLGSRIFKRNKALNMVNPKPQTSNIKHIVIFASGAGSNAQKIIDHFRNSHIKVALIACNKPGAGVLSIAAKENIPTLLIEKENFFRGNAYVPQLQGLQTDLIVLAGFLWKIPQALINAFPKKIINIHPALLPNYGGKGMYGQHVHEAVINAGEMQSGITIHYVDEQYDNGDIIFQTGCPVVEGDTPEILAKRIHQLEHLHYPRVIEELLPEA